MGDFTDAGHAQDESGRRLQSTQERKRLVLLFIAWAYFCGATTNALLAVAKWQEGQLVHAGSFAFLSTLLLLCLVPLFRLRRQLLQSPKAYRCSDESAR